MKPKIIFPVILFILLIAYMPQGQVPKDFFLKSSPIKAHINRDILEGPSVLNDPARFVWGASVIRGEDRKYHMLYSTWECGDTLPPFSDSWVLHSQIAYAVSDYPDRDFEFVQIVLRGALLDGDPEAWDAQMVHNPHIRKFDGRYYLYYVGSRDPGKQPAGSSGASLSKRNRVQQNQCIGVIHFDHFDDLLEGNFTRPAKPLFQPGTRVKPDRIIRPSPEGTIPGPDNIIVTNPGVVYRPMDEKYLLYFKGNHYTPGWKGVHGVAIGDSPAGPFVAEDSFAFDIRDAQGNILSGEDPCVWYDGKRNKFFAILKDFSGGITGSAPGLALLGSTDGIHWDKPDNSFFMRKQLTLENGKTIPVNRLERPQLLFDAHGEPVVLFCAASLVDCGNRKDAVTFNVHIPLMAH